MSARGPGLRHYGGRGARVVSQAGALISYTHQRCGPLMIERRETQ